MLIQTAYNLLPNKKSCNNGAVLFGSSVSSMSMSLSQLSHVKMLGHANYSIMRSCYNEFLFAGGPDQINTRISASSGGIHKGFAESHKLMYQSTLLSRWLCILVGYESGANSRDSANPAYSPQIDVKLNLLHDSGSGYADVGTFDEGIRLDAVDALRQSSYASSDFSGQFVASSGITIPSAAPTNVSPVPPRPLYIPEDKVLGGTLYTVRGGMINIVVSCLDCKLRSLTVFDIYEADL